MSPMTALTFCRIFRFLVNRAYVEFSMSDTEKTETGGFSAGELEAGPLGVLGDFGGLSSFPPLDGC